MTEYNIIESTIRMGTVSCSRANPKRSFLFQCGVMCFTSDIITVQKFSQ